MRLTHLSLTNFRNFARLDVDIPGGPVLLVGGNAQGKTSLLEAAYYLATFDSFHASSDRQLINFIAARETLAVTRIVADFERANPGPPQPGMLPAAYGPGKHQLEVRLIQESGDLGGIRLRKEVLVDGVKRKISEAMGALNAVLFLPQMLRLIEGSPEERRRYLNSTLSQVLPYYAAALTQYSQVLTQRNALLKQLGERGSERNNSAGRLDYWDEQLAQFGARLIHARIQALHELENISARFHHELTRSQEVLRLVYQPSFDPMPCRPHQYTLPLETPIDRSPLSIDKIQQGFLQRLHQAHGEDIARGVTVIGPHRDELRFLSNGIDLGLYGSRGQVRSAVLSLKLAEVDWMRQKTGQWPLLLLDEVLAELDQERRKDLLNRLLQSEQAMLTTTDLDLFAADFVAGATLWRIGDGRLEMTTHER